MKSHVTQAVEEQIAKNEAALRLGRGVLHTSSGDIRIKKIGQGSFSTAYEEVGGDRVFAVSDNDVPDKAIAAEAHRRLPDNPHIPEVELFGRTENKTVYAMPRYKSPIRKRATPEAWQDYQYIDECYKYAADKGLGTARTKDVLSCMWNQPVSEELPEAMKVLADVASRYSEDYIFEFSPDNLAADSFGQLVLLDVLVEPDLLVRKTQKVDQSENIAHMRRHLDKQLRGAQ